MENNDNNFLPSNIKILREEARLSIEEFAERAGVSVEVVKAWENGSLRPYTKDLMVICPILRIHEDDLLTRDIASERREANKRMKNSDSRKNYNWYYGSRKKILFYLLALILIPLTFGISYLLFKQIGLVENIVESMKIEGIEPSWITYHMDLFYAYSASAICSLIFIIIEVIKKMATRIQWWYIIIAISLSSLIIMLSEIIVIPYYIYCLYQVIFKRGKN